MNIIYKNINDVLVTDHNKKSFAECCIYVPASLNFDIVTFYINKTAIETSEVVSDKNGYRAYKISPTRQLNLKDGHYKVFTEGINFKNKSVSSFVETNLTLSFENYNNQVISFYSSCLGDDIANKYSKISEMVKLCIDIYNSTKGA